MKVWSNQGVPASLTESIDRFLAAPMFWLSSAWLLLLAPIPHLWEVEEAWLFTRICLILLLGIYPIFWLEVALHRITGGRLTRQHWWVCLIPLLRLGSKDHVDGTRVWLPATGWQTCDRSLVDYLARRFSIPMISISLCVLPVIIIPFFWYEQVEANPGFAIAIQAVTSVIWAAFTFEFVLMMSVVRRPYTYALKNWIDLAIILLPLIAFLRAARLTQLMRVKHLAKTARVYRLRGLALRMWRGFITLEIIDKILSRNPERRLEKLELLLEEKNEEVDMLRKDIAKLRQKVAEKKAAELAKEQEEEAAEAQSEVECDG